jgi:hypothetical protein
MCALLLLLMLLLLFIEQLLCHYGEGIPALSWREVRG